MLQEYKSITEIINFPNPYSNKCTPYQKFDFKNSYFKTFRNELHHILTAKVVVLGDISVGKSSLINR